MRADLQIGATAERKKEARIAQTQDDIHTPPLHSVRTYSLLSNDGSPLAKSGIQAALEATNKLCGHCEHVGYAGNLGYGAYGRDTKQELESSIFRKVVGKAKILKRRKEGEQIY